MKWLYFVSMILMMTATIPVSFAQQCKVNPAAAISPIINLAKSGFSTTCMLQREQYKCAELESELEGDEKKKVIQCDSKSIEENKLSNVSLTSCVWNGIKISGEQLLDLTKLPGQIAEIVAKGFHETQLCNASLDKKRELLTAYNLTISDKRFTLSEQFLGKWLEDASCAEIDKLLWARYQNYQNVLMNERIAAINTGKKPVALEAKKDDGPGIIELLKSAMSAAQVRYECYTPKVKAEMICAGVTSLIVDTAMGMGIKSAVTKISAIVKSKKALSNINRAVAAGEKAHLTDAAKLTNADRKRAALVLLNENLAANAPKRILTEAEENALIKAHEVGKPRGYFTYTKEDLAEKARLLKEAGFTANERRILMENGIAGEITDPWTINAITTHYKKVLGQAALTSEKSAAIIKFESAGSSTSQAFLKLNAREFLEKSGFSKEEIDAILAAKKAEEMRLAKGLPYKEPVMAVAKVAAKTNAVTKPTTNAAVDVVEQTVASVAEKAEKMSLKDAIAESEKLRLPRDSKGMRLKVNGKEVVAGPLENEASSEYLLRAAKLEREAAEEAYKKKNRTLKADVSYMNKYVENALEQSLKGDGTVAKKIVQEAMKGNGNTMRDMNELVTHLYQNAYEFPNATEAQKALSQLRKQNLKKVLEEIKAQKGDGLLTNGNNSVFRSMLGGVSSN
jgi:hypothetical protein